MNSFYFFFLDCHFGEQDVILLLQNKEFDSGPSFVEDGRSGSTTPISFIYFFTAQGATLGQLSKDQD